MPCVLVLIENNHPDHMNHPQSGRSGSTLWENYLVCSRPRCSDGMWGEGGRRKVVQRAKRRPPWKEIAKSEDST